jgi:tartrate-resistant acid phosphatase type 5
MSCCPTAPTCPTDECCPEQDYGYSASKVTVWQIGDFGVNSTDSISNPATDPNALAVSELVKWGLPDLVLMSGDCRYNNDYVQTVGTLYGSLKTAGKLVPCPGNRDWDYGGLANYLAYFGLGRYYTRRIGPVEFFALDSGFDSNYAIVEPDGIIAGTVTETAPRCCNDAVTLSGGSVQWEWFLNAYAASTARWKIPFFHHPPYASGNSHWGASPEVKRWGSTKKLQWADFVRLGVPLVISSHEHSYERSEKDGVVYVVNGLGGRSITGFGDPVLTESQITYNAAYGALRLVFTDRKLYGTFFDVNRNIIDEFEL